MTNNKAISILVAFYFSISPATAERIPDGLKSSGFSLDLTKMGNPETLTRLGNHYLSNGNSKFAAQFFQVALQKKARYRPALLGMARVNMFLGHYDKARSIIETLIKRKSKSREALLGQAMLANHNEQPQKALDFLEKAKDAGVDPIVVLAETGLAYDLLGQFTRAQHSYKDGLNQAPNNITLIKRLSLSYALSRNYDMALNNLQTLARDNNASEAVRAALAKVYALSGQPDASLQILGQGGPDRRPQKRPFYSYLSSLNPIHQAIAVHLDRFPRQVNLAELQRIPTQAPRPGRHRQYQQLQQPIHSQQTLSQQAPLPYSQQKYDPQQYATWHAENERRKALQHNRTNQAAITGQQNPPTYKPPYSQSKYAVKNNQIAIVSGQPQTRSQITVHHPTNMMTATRPSISANASSQQAGQSPKQGRKKGKGVYWVQLASSTSREDLPLLWSDRSRKAGDLFAATRPWVMPVMIKGEQYHRLLVGPFSKKTAMRQLQSSLNERGIEAISLVAETMVSSLD